MQTRAALRHHRRLHLPDDKNLPMLSAQLFEAALGLSKPWYVTTVDFDQKQRTLTIGIDFEAGARFAAPGIAGQNPVHDTQVKRYRHLNFFQHECMLEVRVPRVKLPDSKRLPMLPDVPTFNEAGIPGFEASGWLGLADHRRVSPGPRLVLGGQSAV